jgi:5-methyltetrahydrofolate--homocysteine methyltransferase
MNISVHGNIPLMIGGATTSRGSYRCEELLPIMTVRVIYVPDASRSVSVASNLLSDESAKQYIQLN